MPYCINIELANSSELAQTMSTIRSWLDNLSIDATGFTLIRAESGALVINLCFATESDAKLFNETYMSG